MLINGYELDKAYIDNEVAYHKAVISTLKEVLIPQASNGELNGFLQAILPALETHLHQAEKVQEQFH